MRYRYQTSKHRILDPDEILVDSVSVLGRGDILEGKIEQPLGKFSSLLFLFVMVGGVMYLGARAASLQIFSGDTFFFQSQENRFLIRPLIPPRGVVYDSHHNVLVQNLPSFTVFFEKEAFIFAARNREQECVESSGGALSSCGSLTSLDIQSRLQALVERLGAILKKDREFFVEIGLEGQVSFAAVPVTVEVMRDMPLDMVSLLRSEELELPGIRIVESYRREYRDALATSHILGFTGRVSGEDAAADPSLSYEDVVGKAGVEAYYDEILRGGKGKKIIEIDSRGVQTRFRMTQDPVGGDSIRLALDGNLQAFAYETLDRFTKGIHAASVVVLDSRNGAVRTLVSFPGFDINKFGSSMRREEFDQILTHPLKPLFNRAIAGEYPSGSTIKPLFGAAALQEGIIDPAKKIYDEGFIEIPNPYRPGETAIFRDWKKHGWVDFEDAIAQSANVYFYMIGGGYEDQQGLGIGRLAHYAKLFGLGSKLGVDLPGEKPGFIPDPETKKITEPDDPVWRIGDTYNVSIGQGGVEVTPLQITVVTAAIANGGTLWRPYVLEAILDSRGNESKAADPFAIRTSMVDKRHLDRVRDAMRTTVTSGTARMLSDIPLNIAGKTGTAQAGSGKPHAWVTAFAPLENPEIAITVMVEHAGEGSTVAVPIMHEILSWYYQNRFLNE